MQDLKDAALAEDGADSGAGGLEGLYDLSGGDDGLPDFFKTGVASNPTASRAGGVQGVGVGEDGRGAEPSSLFDQLSSFSLGGGQHDDGAALFASLGLQTVGDQRRRGGLLSSGGDNAGVGSGALGDGERGSFGDSDQSEWARMQKQFEDMNKSFLQE